MKNLPVDVVLCSIVFCVAIDVSAFVFFVTLRKAYREPYVLEAESRGTWYILRPLFLSRESCSISMYTDTYTRGYVHIHSADRKSD